ncbi:MAG: methyltransferase family protein [Chloroflexota bacterium]
MKIDTFERWARRSALVGLAGFIVVVLQGLAQSRRHRKGRVSGPAAGSLRWLRAAYLPMSVVALWVLGKAWRPLPLSLSPRARFLATAAGGKLFFLGLGLFLWGRRTMGDMYDLSSSLGAELYADHRLVTSGPFAIVRHPLYLAGILAEVGALLLFRNWAMALVALNGPTLILRARREEELLAAEFGQQWEEYKARVPMLLPRPRACCADEG